MLRCIGDVHAHIERYLPIVSASPHPTFQVGDMGLGFKDVALPKMSPEHLFIRGNHDSPSICRTHPNYAGDWGTHAGSIFYLGGAWSIDYEWRQAQMAHGTYILKHNMGPLWWPDEELTLEELKSATQLYIDTKPEYVITHECPKVVAKEVLSQVILGDFTLAPTRTREYLTDMFQAYQPKTWVFGHYHIPFDKVISGTRFVCVPELEYFDLNIGD